MKIGVSAFAWTTTFSELHIDLLPKVREQGLAGFEILRFELLTVDRNLLTCPPLSRVVWRGCPKSFIAKSSPNCFSTRRGASPDALKALQSALCANGISGFRLHSWGNVYGKAYWYSDGLGNFLWAGATSVPAPAPECGGLVAAPDRIQTARPGAD